jgi:single-stranded DNA-binding protein
MNSINVFTFSGRLAEPVYFKAGEGAKKSHVRMKVIQDTYVGYDEQKDEPIIKPTTVSFVAWGSLAEYIGKTALQGDQFFITANVQNNSYLKVTGKEDSRVYEHQMIIDTIVQGASGQAREKLKEIARDAVNGELGAEILEKMRIDPYVGNYTRMLLEKQNKANG